MSAATTTPAAAAAPEVRQVPLAELHESPSNSRRIFDKGELRELAATIKDQGILQPLVVRYLDKPADGLEIVAGARRFRAAKLAGLAMVPAIVRELSDEQALEVQAIENLQRAGLHPLEEAVAYQNLVRAGNDVARVAERVGRSLPFVYDRIKLLGLTTKAQDLFREGHFELGHAILLARLSPKDQARALDPKDGGVFEYEQRLLGFHKYDDDDKAEGKGKDPLAGLKPRSVPELRDWINKNVRFDTAEPDAMLFPETAKKLAGAQQQEETVVHITHEYHVDPEAKGKQRTYGPQSWKRADGSSRNAKACDSAVTGVIVVGDGRGQAFKVCVDKKGCKKHWSSEQRDAKKRAGAGRTARSGEDSWKAQEQKRQEQEARDLAERDRFAKALPEVLAALAERVTKAPAGPGGLLGKYLLAEAGRTLSRAPKAADYVAQGRTAEDLVRHLVFLRLCNDTTGWYAFRDFHSRAKAFGVDVRAIVDKIAPKVKAPAAANPPAKASKGKARKAGK